MRNLTIVAGLVLALTGCGKNKFDQAVSDMEGLKDKMCACTDKACADKVNDEYREWRKSMKEKFKKEDDKDASEEQTKRAKAADAAFHECRSKLKDSGGTETKDKPADPPKP
jgi:hypothetical protein